jgi:sortase (surface protein transpeptidase)
MVSRLQTLLASCLLLLTTAASLAEQHDPSTEPDQPVEPISAGGVPIWLRIPSIGVDADIVPVEMDDDGAMSAPEDPDTVAWWSLGYGTGVPGNIVLAAHINWGGKLRVFGRLQELGPGDQVVLVDDLAREFIYEVAWSYWVDAEGAAVEEIFDSSGGLELTLITCGGRYDPATRTYADRLIARAGLV